nr:hypothetical protein [Deinococcus budaensis]
MLVTVWAVVTALGARRGLPGLLWGLGGVAACLLVNLLAGRAGAGGLLLAAGLAVGAGAALAFSLRRWCAVVPGRRWHGLAGGLGGAALGGVLVATLTLGFPIEVRVGTQGRTGVYPSTRLPTALYTAVNQSVLKDGLMGVWDAGAGLRTLLVPDRR